MNCKRCNGKGSEYLNIIRDTVPCPDCNGTGKLSLNPPPQRLPGPVRDYVCGTRRASTLRPGDHRVYCATCGAGGGVLYRTREAALHAATRDSARPCKACGAR